MDLGYSLIIPSDETFTLCSEGGLSRKHRLSGNEVRVVLTITIRAHATERPHSTYIRTDTLSDPSIQVKRVVAYRQLDDVVQ